MIKFFLHIRQKLISENPPTRKSWASKYLLYAIGEILLVVIGMLIENFKSQEFVIKDYLEMFKDISTASATRDLKKGIEENLWKKVGDNRTSKYQMKILILLTGQTGLVITSISII